MTGYMFSALWLIIAIYLFVQAIKTEKFLFFLSVFFLFMSGWYLANELLPIDLFSSYYGWIFRGVALLALIICGVKYLLYKRAKNDE